MKKIVSIIMALAMLMLFSACGKTETNTPANDVGTSSSSETTESKTDSQSPESKNVLTSTYKVPLKNIYVDTPNYQEIEQAFTELFIIHDSRYISFTAAKMSTANSSKQAHDEAFKELIPNMQNYAGGINGIKISKDEEVQINGMDVYSFEGTINYGTDTKFDGYAKVYSFVLDGVPCEIIGSVIDKSQDKELIKEIEEIVSEMIKTVRTEE